MYFFSMKSVFPSERLSWTSVHRHDYLYRRWSTAASAMSWSRCWGRSYWIPTEIFLSVVPGWSFRAIGCTIVPDRHKDNQSRYTCLQTDRETWADRQTDRQSIKEMKVVSRKVPFTNINHLNVWNLLFQWINSWLDSTGWLQLAFAYVVLECLLLL